MKSTKNKTYLQLVELIIDQQERLYRIAYTYVRHEQDALDITQEAIYKALKNVHQVREPSYLKTWLIRIVITTSLSYLQKKKPLLFEEHLEETIAMKQVDPCLQLDMEKALAMLPGEDQTIILLRYFEDLKIKDIGLVLGLNINTVKTKLYGAHKKLRHLLESEGSYEG